MEVAEVTIQEEDKKAEKVKMEMKGIVGRMGEKKSSYLCRAMF